jgi:repressor of nif and glnA expression
MPFEFAELLLQDRRLVMLRSIAEEGNSLNESLLQSVLAAFGHNVSRDYVRTQMRWLDEQGLISVEAVAGILVGKLTGRGMDCAEGRCKVDGVKTPRPKG